MPWTPAESVSYVETNLTAPFVVSQACIPYMKVDGAGGKQIQEDSDSDAGPCIIHIGSFRALQSDPHQEGYASTKAGLLGLLHSMAISLQPHGIRVNLVAPGRIKVGHESKHGDENGLTWMNQHAEKDVTDHATNRAGRPKVKVLGMYSAWQSLMIENRTSQMQLNISSMPVL